MLFLFPHQTGRIFFFLVQRIWNVVRSTKRSQTFVTFYNSFITIKTNEYSSRPEMTRIRDNALHKMRHVTKPLSLSVQELCFSPQDKRELLLEGVANKILWQKELVRHKEGAQLSIPLRVAKGTFK